MCVCAALNPLLGAEQIPERFYSLKNLGIIEDEDSGLSDCCDRWRDETDAAHSELFGTRKALGNISNNFSQLVSNQPPQWTLGKCERRLHPAQKAIPLLPMLAHNSAEPHGGDAFLISEPSTCNPHAASKAFSTLHASISAAPLS